MTRSDNNNNKKWLEPEPICEECREYPCICKPEEEETDEIVGGYWPPGGGSGCILMECRKCGTEYPLSMGHECPPKWEDDPEEIKDHD